MKKREKKEIEIYNRIFDNKKVYEMTEEEKEEVITKEIAQRCRHRLEKRWYRRLIELNILIIGIVIGVVIYNFSSYEKSTRGYIVEKINNVLSYVGVSFDEENISLSKESDNTTKKENEDTSKDNKKKSKEIPLMVKILFIGIGSLIVTYLSLYYYYAYYSATSVRITKENFPEVYETIENYSKRLGMKTPNAYVRQQSGVLNAFSTFLFRRQWIMIHSEVFEVAYREYKDMDALNFIIAHELSHIYYGHATLSYQVKICFSSIIPIIGSIASRTREYSCDRLAQRLTGVDGMDAMLMLVVDRHLYKKVDKKDYMDEMKKKRGFFIWVANLVLDHPIMSKRMIALEQGKGSGALY